MKKITAVVAPKACSESGKKLAEALGVPYLIPSQLLRGLRVFNYGSSCIRPEVCVVNKPHAVERCVDKIATLRALRDAGVPHTEFRTRKQDIPADWDWVVVRTILDGKQNDGMEYVQLPNKLPDAPLYTRWFDHRHEYRIMVFQGRVVGRYRKDADENNQWWLMTQTPRGFKEMDAACEKAAKALGIDYVGFDVLAKNKKDFVICEANSGPAMTDDVLPQLVAALS